MFFFSICLFLPIIDTIIITRIHRSAIFNPNSSCALLRNVSIPIDGSIQSCIWECFYENNCQTSVYFYEKKICLLYTELCELTKIESLGNVHASVICHKKSHNPIITCPVTTISHQLTTEITVLPSVVLSTTQNPTSTSSSMIPTNTTGINVSSPYIVSLPFFGNTWTCINVSSSISSATGGRFYIKQGLTYSISYMTSVTAYLESDANSTINSCQYVMAYVESNAVLSTPAIQNVTVYLASKASLSLSSCGSAKVYMESEAKLSISNCGSVQVYLKSNASMDSANNYGQVTAYYESGAQRIYPAYSTPNETLCSSITFNYSNSSTRTCQ
ncbi:hypothetical protein I4U23_023053 [Adineta vaga]|nr:hypothetical protein I4U23_023053 [Adineta vaga]